MSLRGTRMRSRGCWWCSYPSFCQVFADPCRQTAVAVLQAYPNAKAIGEAGVKTLAALLHASAPHHYGRKTAERLVDLAKHSVSSDLAVEARSLSGTRSGVSDCNRPPAIWSTSTRRLSTCSPTIQELKDCRWSPNLAPKRWRFFVSSWERWRVSSGSIK
jgi:hypothetical protein